MVVEDPWWITYMRAFGESSDYTLEFTPEDSELTISDVSFGEKVRIYHVDDVLGLIECLKECAGMWTEFSADAKLDAESDFHKEWSKQSEYSHRGE